MTCFGSKTFISNSFALPLDDIDDLHFNFDYFLYVVYTSF